MSHYLCLQIVLMAKILLLSDTHSYMDDTILKQMEDCDEVWHAGDIGNLSVCDKIKAIKPLRAVWGNIDNHEARAEYKEELIFEIEGKKVWMIHIGGYPGRYTAKIKKKLQTLRPDIFICGHSHILKVIYDKELQLLHLNPGSCGIYGIHQIRTLLKFEIKDNHISNMQIVELGAKKK